MTERQIKAAILIGLGILLINSPEPLSKMAVGSAPPLVMSLIYALGPVGLILIVIGIYRAATQGKS